MTISDAKGTAAYIVGKAAAAYSLLSPVHNQAFSLSLRGVLGNGSPEEQREAAYLWLDENYALVGGAILAAVELAEDVCDGLSELFCMLAELEEGL